MKPAELAAAAGTEWCQDLCLLLCGWEGEQAPRESVSPSAGCVGCFQPVNSRRLLSALTSIYFGFPVRQPWRTIYSEVLEAL